MLLPIKKSYKWLYFLLIVFAINLLALSFTRVLLTQTVSFQNIVGFSIMSIVAALLASAGFLGFRTFTRTILIADFVAILYMFAVILSNAADGWSDLTSLAAYTVILAIGILAGVAAQFIEFLFVRSKKNAAD